jgi:hypothetical protein
MLILTLSISAFKPEEPSESNKAGDYSAVFPLLVIAVFTALMASVGTTFYSAQTSRGDIVAVPEILCRPGRTGNPIITQFGGSDSSRSDDGSIQMGSFVTVSNEVDRWNDSAPSDGRKASLSPSPTNGRRRPSPRSSHVSPIDTEIMDVTILPPPPPELPSPASVTNKFSRENSLSRFMKDREYKRAESYTPPSNYRKHDNSSGSSITTEKKVRHHTFGNLDGRQQPSLLDQARKNSNHSITQQHTLHRRTSSNPFQHSSSDTSQSSR